MLAVGLVSLAAGGSPGMVREPVHYAVRYVSAFGGGSVVGIGAGLARWRSARAENGRLHHHLDTQLSADVPLLRIGPTWWLWQ